MKLKLSTSILIGALSVTACRKAPAANAQTANSPAATTGPAAAPSGPPAPAAPPKPVPAQLPDVVARVNGEEVKKPEFERMIHTLEQRAGQQIPAERRDEILRGALDQLVVYTLLSQESRNRGIKVEDSEIDQKVEQLRSKFPTQDAFTKALAERGMTMDRLKHDARVDLSVTKLMDAETATEPGPSEQDAKDLLREESRSLQAGRKGPRQPHPDQASIRRRDAAAKQKARAEIDAVLKQAKAGGDFAQAGAGALAGRQRRAGRRPQLFHARADGPGIREGRVLAEARRDQRRGRRRSSATTSSRWSNTRRRGPSRSRKSNAQIKQFLGNQKKQQHADAFIEGLKKKSKIEVLI